MTQQEIQEEGHLYTEDKKRHLPLNNNPIIPNLGLFPETIVEDVEKLAELKYPISKGGSMWMPTRFDLNQSYKQEGFVEGYKKATKVYSEEDLIEFSIWRSSTNTTEFNKCNNIKEQLKLWQSLKQSKTPRFFVVEIIDTNSYGSEVLTGSYDSGNFKLKTTTKNGKTYLVGTYLN